MSLLIGLKVRIKIKIVSGLATSYAQYFTSVYCSYCSFLKLLNIFQKFQHFPEGTSIFLKVPALSWKYQHFPEGTSTFLKVPALSWRRQHLPEGTSTFLKGASTLLKIQIHFMTMNMGWDMMGGGDERWGGWWVMEGGVVYCTVLYCTSYIYLMVHCWF